MKKTDIFQKINKFYIDKNNCFVWTGNKTHDNYGRIRIGNKKYRVHRIVYILYYGEIPKNKPYICHKCNNSKCINPEHLYAGTPKDNVRDMINAKRNNHLKGEKHPKAKLKKHQILEIRNLHKKGYSIRKIAKKYNMGKTTIQLIINKKIWKHI